MWSNLVYDCQPNVFVDKGLVGICWLIPSIGCVDKALVGSCCWSPFVGLLWLEVFVHINFNVQEVKSLAALSKISLNSG